MQLCRTGSGRLIVAVATMSTLAAGLFLGAPGATALPSPPPPAPSASAPGSPPPVSNPTNDQLRRADAAKVAKDQEIGVLSGEIAAAQARLDYLQRREEQAEQKVALTYTQYRDAVAQATQAKRAARTAVTKVQNAQTRFAQYMQATYISGQPAGMTGTLLTAADPSALLDQSSYQQFEAQHNAGIIGQMQTLSVAKSNAQARAVRAQLKAEKAKVAAERAQREAADAVDDQQSEQAGLQATMSQKQNELITAKAQVVQLYNNRATNVRYQQELAAFTKYKTYLAQKEQYEAALKAERARQRARQQAEAKRARERAKQRAERDRDNGNNSGNSGGGNSGGGSSGGGNSGGSDDDDPPRNSPPAPSGGSWSMAKAKRAVARAKSTLGTPYAWAGGGARGPSYGACVPSAGAPNDCYIKGYDCSGLVMFAWGKNWNHYADTQYSQAGSFHPKRNQLKPGDLVFYGYRGGGSDLHHVAMYIGNGRIIEAPYSGGYVQYNDFPAYSDYYGATRPLT